MDKFIVNIIHRPEMVPEYSATVTGQGKEEDIGDKALLTESLDIFKTQQRLAHENGLKVTIQMTYASLFNDEAVEIAKHPDTEIFCLIFLTELFARQLLMMCSRNSMIVSAFIRSQPVPTIWMQN